MIPDLKVLKTTITNAKSYRFEFEHGWAIFTINDATGEFFLDSDWGRYGYRWPLEERTLTSFLADFLVDDPSYVVAKFRHTNKEDLDDCVDEDATRKSLKIALAERYRNNVFPEQRRARGRSVEWDVFYWDITYRELIDEIHGFDFDGDIWSNLSENLAAVFEDPYELCDLIRYRESGRSMVLRLALLPFFGRYLQDLDDDRGSSSMIDFE